MQLQQTTRLRPGRAPRTPTHLVDMEGYAVAYACRAFGAPARLIKHVSDQADAAAMDWPTLVDASARALGGWLADRL